LMGKIMRIMRFRCRSSSLLSWCCSTRVGRGSTRCTDISIVHWRVGVTVSNTRRACGTSSVFFVHAFHLLYNLSNLHGFDDAVCSFGVSDFLVLPVSDRKHVTSFQYIMEIHRFNSFVHCLGQDTSAKRFDCFYFQHVL
jgi:hypothetical protein